MPFSSDTDHRHAHEPARRPLPPHERLGPLNELLAQAAAPNPAERYTASELARRLYDLRSSLPPPTPLPIAQPLTRRAASSRPPSRPLPARAVGAADEFWVRRPWASRPARLRSAARGPAACGPATQSASGSAARGPAACGPATSPPPGRPTGPPLHEPPVDQPTGQMASQVTSQFPSQATSQFSGQDAPTLPVTSDGQDRTELGIPPLP